MFDTAIYTDVTAEDSLDGRGGFNFQAASAGFTGADQRVAIGQLLHEVDISRHPANESDLSAAYRSEGRRLYFSRGIGLGATASGRPGNQLTQIAATSEPDDLGSLCPAQVLSSPCWTLERSPSPEAECWPAPVAPSPEFELSSLVAWAQSSSERWEFLPRFLMAFEEKITGTSSSQIVLAHDDMDILLRWLALASLLSNQRAVRSLSFRAFASGSSHHSEDVIGCRLEKKDSFPAARVFDLASLNGPLESPLSFAVERSIALLETCDVLEAAQVISLARSWDPFLGQTAAFWTSELLNGTLPESARGKAPLSVVDIINTLAHNGFTDDLEVYGDELAEAIKHSQIESDPIDLLRASRSAEAIGDEALAEMLLDASIQGLAQQSDRLEAWISDLHTLSGSGWPQVPFRTEWSDLLAQAASTAPAHVLGVTLRVAEPLRAVSPARSWRTTEERMARHLLETPHAVNEVRGLEAEPRILEQALESLLEAFYLTPIQYSDEKIPAIFMDLSTGRWSDLFHAATTNNLSQMAKVHHWIQLATLSSLRSRERMTFLSVEEEHLEPHDWPFVLHNSTPSGEPELWAMWINNHATPSTLQTAILQEFERDLEKPPVRTLKKWHLILDALEKSPSHPTDIDVSPLRVRLDNHIAGRGSARDKITSVFTRGRESNLKNHTTSGSRADTSSGTSSTSSGLYTDKTGDS